MLTQSLKYVWDTHCTLLFRLCAVTFMKPTARSHPVVLRSSLSVIVAVTRLTDMRRFLAKQCVRCKAAMIHSYRQEGLRGSEVWQTACWRRSCASACVGRSILFFFQHAAISGRDNSHWPLTYRSNSFHWKVKPESPTGEKYSEGFEEQCKPKLNKRYRPRNPLFEASRSWGGSFALKISFS